MKRGALVLWCAGALSLTGCAALPTPKDVIEAPFTQTNLKLGMPKAEVEALWGKPDETAVDKKGRETWHYEARTALPVGINYLSKSRTLTFDASHLVKIE